MKISLSLYSTIFCGGAVACPHADKTGCRGLTPQPLCLKTAARRTAHFKGDILPVFSIFSVLENIACRRQRLQDVLHGVNITTVPQQGKASRLVVHDTNYMGLCAFVKERERSPIRDQLQSTSLYFHRLLSIIDCLHYLIRPSVLSGPTVVLSPITAHSSPPLEHLTHPINIIPQR